MTILAIDCRYLGKGSGIAEMFNPLVHDFLNSSNNIKIFFLCYRDNVPEYCKNKDIIYLQRPDSTSSLIKQNLFEIRKLLINSGVTLYFSPYYDSLVFSKKIKSISTIHDLAFFSITVKYPLHVRLYFLFLLLAQTFFSHRIVFISNVQRNIYLKHFPFKFIKSKIKIIKNSYDYKNNFMKSLFIRKKNINNEIIFLYTAGFEQRKNIQLLLELFEYGLHAYKARCITSGTRKQMESFIPQSEHHRLDALTFLGYLSSEKLEELYLKASVVLVPSLYEGFGRSVAESISYACPVVCYDLEVYREFFEDIPYYAKSKEDFIICIDKCLKSHSPKLPLDLADYKNQLSEFRNLLCSQS